MTTTATAPSGVRNPRASLISRRLFDELFGLAFLTWIGFTLTILGITEDRPRGVDCMVLAVVVVLGRLLPSAAIR